MSLFAFKLAAIAAIVVVALAGGFAAVGTRRARNAERLFSLGALFGAGVFLGAGLIHMLPDAVEALNGRFPDYPVPFALAALGLIAVLAIDRVGHALRARRISGAEGEGTTGAILLLVVLSFHSILAGAAMGAENSTANSAVLLLAILAHKGSAAFALTTGLLRDRPAGQGVWPLLAVFAAMTPAGILAGAGLQEALSSSSARLAEGLFDAVAAATFLYVATLEVIGPEFRKPGSAAANLAVLSAGLGVMALVAVWL
jgi:zinc transporter 1/2/3